MPHAGRSQRCVVERIWLRGGVHERIWLLRQDGLWGSAAPANGQGVGGRAIMEGVGAPSGRRGGAGGSLLVRPARGRGAGGAQACTQAEGHGRRLGPGAAT